MGKLHSYHLEKYNIDIDVIEFEHRHFYLKVSQFEKLSTINFNNWLTNNSELKKIKSELYYDQYGYESSQQYLQEIVKDKNDETICSDILMLNYINDFDEELYSEIWKIIDFLRN